jgi:hypothetical protein
LRLFLHYTVLKPLSLRSDALPRYKKHSMVTRDGLRQQFSETFRFRSQTDDLVSRS